MTILHETVTKIRAFTTKNVDYLDNSDLHLQLRKMRTRALRSKRVPCFVWAIRAGEVTGRTEDPRVPSFSFLADQRATARTPREVFRPGRCALERGKRAGQERA